MASYLVRGGKEPRFFTSKLETNELVGEAKRTSAWRSDVPNVLILVGVFGLFGTFLRWAIAGDRYVGDYCGICVIAGICGALLILGGYLAGLSKPILYVVPSQSFRTPRKAFLVDSWHVCVPEAGSDFQNFERRLVCAISPPGPSIGLAKELHQQIRLSPRGFDERERYVLTKGQANIHVHIYPFGRDAYVGRDGYLN